jgi:hypothetical protein
VFSLIALLLLTCVFYEQAVFQLCILRQCAGIRNRLRVFSVLAGAAKQSKLVAFADT